MISTVPGIFIRRRGIFKYSVLMFWGVFVSGHVLVYLGISMCLDVSGCMLVYLDISGYVWNHLRCVYIYLDICGCVWI